MISALIESMRPKQWTKNFLVLGGVVFSLNLFNFHLLIKANTASKEACVILVKTGISIN